MKREPVPSAKAVEFVRALSELPPAKRAAVLRFMEIVRNGTREQVERERVKILDRFGIPH